jgi:hypothetical protein
MGTETEDRETEGTDKGEKIEMESEWKRERETEGGGTEGRERGGT